MLWLGWQLENGRNHELFNPYLILPKTFLRYPKPAAQVYPQILDISIYLQEKKQDT